MKLKSIEIDNVRFLELKNIGKRDLDSLYKKHYGCVISTDDGDFIKVTGIPSVIPSSRAGFSLVHVNDVEKYEKLCEVMHEEIRKIHDHMTAKILS